MTGVAPGVAMQVFDTPAGDILSWALELNAIQDYFLTWSRELAEQHAARMRAGEAQAAEIEEEEARLDEYAEWYDDGYRVV